MAAQHLVFVTFSRLVPFARCRSSVTAALRAMDVLTTDVTWDILIHVLVNGKDNERNSMSRVEDLKREAYQLARRANDLAATINRYTTSTSDAAQNATKLLEGTGSGLDRRVAADLQETNAAIKRTQRVLQQVGDVAASYARRI